MIKHIVMIKMKAVDPDIKVCDIKLIENALNGLPAQINEIVDYEVGVNCAESERAYDMVLLSSFNSEADLEAYRIHPAHLKIVKLIKEYTDNTIVVDYKI